ncbi:hypothetical protein [Salinicola rhizosphaerae]|uniref:Uncharacterized protein n=1 Tax=Salinicola rhizosphaerae TaxID=1443141 RepID=A0ABQ3DSU1_9GAMM|nr:hypothetical protein [Salinicola rhizosphaerae]GHB11806.1 hypothetical protein GCM10009038_06710 [Salinicola rhizosphaerae]
MRIGERATPAERREALGVEPISPTAAERNIRTRDAFTRAISEARQQRSLRPALRQRLSALAAPAPSDPATFSGARSIELLEHVIDHLLPELEVDEATRDAARSILHEELQWRQAYDGRINEPLAIRSGADDEEETT